MTGETSLPALLKSLSPVLNEGDYVFCSIASHEDLRGLEPQGSFREREGLTVILRCEHAEQLNLNVDYVATWITLNVHSALSAVGLTAAFAAALSRAGISCNVVAGYYHDHLFVAKDDGPRAIVVLQQLASAAE